MTTFGIAPLLFPMDMASAKAPMPENDEVLSSSEDLPWRKARFMVETQTGTRTIGTIDALVPFMGDNDFLVYANLMAKYGTGANNANGNTFEGNIGLGLRRVNDAENAIFGVYAYYDSLRSVNNNQFTQVTVGAERLGLTWDFRGNVYLPIGKTKYNKIIHKGGSSFIEEHNVIENVKSRKEVSSAGADFEIGRTLGSDKLRGYFGVYSFGSELTGPRARIEYKLNNHITFTSTAQYDKERNGQFLFGARFTLGGAKAASNNIYSRMTAPVIRDVDVVTKVTDTDVTRVANNKVWVVDPEKGTNDGDGTFENPFTYIDEAIEAAPENTHIIVIGKEDSIYKVRDEITLQQGQHIWGGVNDLYYNYELDSFTSAADADAHKVADGNGVRPNLGGNIRMNNNTSLSNVDITADSLDDSTGVIISNLHNVSLNDVTISDFNRLATDRGISIENSTGVKFTNVTLDNNYVGLEAKNSELTSNYLSITNSIAEGMIIDGGVQSYSDLSIKDSGSVGLRMFSGFISLNNINFDGNTTAGILLEDKNIGEHQERTLSITDGIAGDDLELQNTGWQITNTKSSSIAADDGYGIWVKDQSALNASNGSLTDNKAYGMFFDKGVFNLDGMQINGNKAGLYFGKDSTFNDTSILTNSTIENNTGDGLTLNGGNLLVEAVNITNNIGHGMQINAGGNAILNNVAVTKNGLPSIEDAHNLSDLTSGIKITDGHLTASSLTVTENAGGIELLEGSLIINGESTNPGVNSTINNNHGYGIYAHSIGGNDRNDRSLLVNNTSLNENLAIDGVADSGYGIYATDVDSIHLTYSTINQNDNGGLLAHSSNRDARLSIFGSEIKNNKAQSGIDVTGLSAIVNIIGTDISHNAGDGLKVNSQKTTTVTGIDTNIHNNNGHGIDAQGKDKVTVTLSDGTKLNYNKGSGVQAISAESSTDLSIIDGEVRGNNNNGVYVGNESGVLPTGKELTSDVNVINTLVDGNKESGIYIKQWSSGTTILTLDGSTITNNTDGGLFVTHGTLDGTKTGTTLQDNNHIERIILKGDYAKH